MNNSLFPDLKFPGTASSKIATSETSAFIEEFTDLFAYPEEMRNEAIYRLEWIKKLHERGVTKFSEQAVSPLIKTISEEYHWKAPGWRSLHEWNKRFQAAGNNVVALVPQNHRRGNSTSRLHHEVEAFIDCALQRYLSAERPSIQACYDYLKSQIFLANERDHSQLKCPSYVTFSKRVQKISPYNRTKARKGKAAADKEFANVGKILSTKRALERVEVDHTPLDLFVLDDQTNVPIGRPYLTVLLDTHTKSILGFYLGFVPPSTESVLAALKNAIMNKSYIKEKYPSIEQAWLCEGIPETLVVDNGKEFWSEGFSNACHNLNISIAYNPTKKPWLKPSVERYFKTVNVSALSNIPGKTFSNIQEREDYNPEQYAVVRMSICELYLHRWIVDLYQNQPNSRGDNIPNLSWRKATSVFPPAPYTGTAESLDFILSLPTEVALRREGIVRNYLRYHSEELAKFRAEYNPSKVLIKYNPEDLGFIYVLNTWTKNYFRVNAVDHDYANGLSSFQHAAHKRFLKSQLNEAVDERTLMRAKIELQQLIDDEVAFKTASVTQKKRAQRYKNGGASINRSIESRDHSNKMQSIADLDWSMSDIVDE